MPVVLLNPEFSLSKQRIPFAIIVMYNTHSSASLSSADAASDRRSILGIALLLPVLREFKCHGGQVPSPQSRLEIELLLCLKLRTHAYFSDGSIDESLGDRTDRLGDRSILVSAISA